MLTHRVLFSDNGTLTDYSLEAKESTFSFTAVAAEDYIYIGQSFPFNYFYAQVDTANTNASLISIEYLDNNRTWRAAVDILDATKTSGKTLAKSGIVRFSPDYDHNWRPVKDPRDGGEPTELSTLGIWNQYWIRVKFSADLTAVTLSKIGYKFCVDSDLDHLDPDISEYLSNWESGKTDWKEQIIKASTLTVIGLKAKGLISSNAQILKIAEELELLTAYRTLVIIYAGLGPKFKETKDDTYTLYKEILKDIKPITDRDSDARIDDHEETLHHGALIR